VAILGSGLACTYPISVRFTVFEKAQNRKGRNLMAKKVKRKNKSTGKKRGIKGKGKNQQIKANFPAKEKTALVISGGGAHGAFAAGVVTFAIEETPFNPDILIGTSTGSLVNTLAAIEDTSFLKQVYTTTSTEQIVKERGVLDVILGIASSTGASSFLDTSPLESLIDKTLSEKDRLKRIMKSDKTVIFTTVNLNTGFLEYWSTKSHPQPPNGKLNVISDDETFKAALLASSNQPPFLPPVLIQGNFHTDGGVREYTAIQLAIELGASRIFVINLSPDDDTFPPQTNTSYTIREVLFRVLDLVLREANRNDTEIGKLNLQAIDFIRQAEMFASSLLLAGRITQAEFDGVFGPGKNPFKQKESFTSFHIIRPDKPLLGQGLKFEPKIMSQNFETGYKKAKELKNIFNT
jgi:NTE family protein